MEIDKKLEAHFKITQEALKEVKIKIPKKVNLKEVATDLLDLAKRYYKDAKYFKEKGKIVEAFTALNYSHAFLDVGARLKIFDVHDSRLFMVDEDE